MGDAVIGWFFETKLFQESRNGVIGELLHAFKDCIIIYKKVLDSLEGMFASYKYLSF